MIILLNSEENRNKFIRLLPFYKSLFFFYTKFECSNYINENDKYLISALNIKNRKKRITFIYDKACTILDDSIPKKNICGFSNLKCGLHKCNKLNYNYGCCRKCRYVTDSGCPSSNLACKLFNCSYVKKRYKPLSFKNLDILKLLSLKNRIIVQNDYFSLREDVLKDLYSYSFILSGVRIIIRLLKNYIYKKKIDN